MQTFKQFLAELDLLDQTAAEMWLRHHLEVDQEYAEAALEWLLTNETKDTFIAQELWDKMLRFAKKNPNWDAAKANGASEEKIVTVVFSLAMYKDGIRLEDMMQDKLGESADPLELTSVEMWFRSRGFHNDTAAELAEWYLSDDADIMSDYLYNTVEDYFAGTVPYNVLKGDAKESPFEWFHDRFTSEMKRSGFEL